MFKFIKKHKIKLRLFIKSGAGFTTTELLVVIAIIIFLLIVVVSNFAQIRLQFSLSRVVYKFDQDLRKAQNLALSASEYQGTEVVAGYGVKIDLNNLGRKKYNIYADKITNLANCNSNKTNCSGVNSCSGNEENDTLDYLVDTIDFSQTEPGIIIKEIIFLYGGGGIVAGVTNASINFNSCDLLLRTTITSSEAGPPNSAEIVFALESDLTNTRTVLVNKAGLIKVK